MNDIRLLYSTRNQNVDNLLQGIVGVFEMIFPERIRGYFIVGSYATDTAVSTSDLDLVLIFKDTFLAGEEQKAQQLGHCCQLISVVPVDFALYTEERVLQQRNYGGGFALTRRLIYGGEFDCEIPPPPIEKYTQNIMNGTYQVLAGMRPEAADILTFPLNYPDPEGKFYGYERPIHLPDGTIRDGLRQLVGNVCLAASAIIALKVGRCVGSKSESVRAYRECINDEWASFIESFYETSRNEWEYLVPKDEANQKRLQEFCQQTLTFERHFLLIYQDYLAQWDTNEASKGQV